MKAAVYFCNIANSEDGIFAQVEEIQIIIYQRKIVASKHFNSRKNIQKGMEIKKEGYYTRQKRVRKEVKKIMLTMVVKKILQRKGKEMKKI